MESTASELRGALDAAREKGRGRSGYSDELRQAVVGHVRQRREQGEWWRDIAEELGVSAKTLRKWLGRHKPAVRAVQITDNPNRTPAARQSCVVVTLPKGIRVEGLTVADIALLARQVSCSD